MRTIRNTFIKRGLIRPCVPTPLVRTDKGWSVGIPLYDSRWNVLGHATA